MFVRALVVTALVVGAGAASPDVAEAHRRYRRYWGYPSFHRAYGPGYYPAFSIGGIGYGAYPFSVGFSYFGGPKDPRGVVRFNVYPEQAEIYIDGYYAGIVDDFGKLRLEPGPHDITLYLDGYRVFEETIYSTAGSTVRIHHEMVPLAPGEPIPSRPGVPGGGTRASPPLSTSPPSVMRTPSAPPPPSTSEYGELVLRSQPTDPEVFIDGEEWHFSGGSERLTVHLPAGSYELQLRKDGFEPFVTRVDIFPGETTALNVRLGPSPR